MSQKQMKVIKILSRSALVIRLALEPIEIGDVVEVYSPGIQIIDPETGEELGTLDMLKARLVVVQTFPKFFVAENEETQLKLTQNINPAIHALYDTTPKSLNVKVTDVSGDNWRSEEPIQIGDPVRATQKIHVEQDLL